tara:strand:- start:107 stop:1285 length:1179 start_codon:yes stop_codon:yes gene_type:complete
MFEHLKSQPSDKIMELMAQHAKDTRTNKLDLGVGVYKNAEGATPIMKSVKKSEEILHRLQDSKSYIGLIGSIEFSKNIGGLVLNSSVDEKRLSYAQAPGGTGALHQLLLLARATKNVGNVWISDPSWPNHQAILKHLGMNMSSYYYFDEMTCEVNFDKLYQDLSGMRENDILLLHGCCHNPTGANLSFEHWVELTQLIQDKNVLPFIDLAYQGFGDGLTKDVEGLNYLVKNVSEAMIAVSCSKNFGVYRDRVGVAIVVSDATKQHVVQDNLKSLNRLTFSFPPDHGAAVVNQILQDDTLKVLWKDELEEMRVNMLDLRERLATELQRETNSERFSFVNKHRGMFSKLGLNSNQVEVLRKDHGIYMVSDSRINVAGLRKDVINYLATAIADVI